MITKTKINETCIIKNDNFGNTDDCQIIGLLTLKTGSGEVVFSKARNRIVGQGLNFLRDMFYVTYYSVCSGCYSNIAGTSQSTSYFSAGTSASPTLITTQGIQGAVNSVSPVGSQIVYDTSLDKYKYIIVGSWNAGILPAEINEFGMHITMHANVGNVPVPDLNAPTYGTLQGNATNALTVLLFARASVGDGSFNMVQTNKFETYSLEWEILI